MERRSGTRKSTATWPGSGRGKARRWRRWITHRGASAGGWKPTRRRNAGARSTPGSRAGCADRFPARSLTAAGKSSIPRSSRSPDGGACFPAPTLKSALRRLDVPEESIATEAERPSHGPACPAALWRRSVGSPAPPLYDCRRLGRGTHARQLRLETGGGAVHGAGELAGAGAPPHAGAPWTARQ